MDVSVIIAVKNNASTLPACLESVLSQRDCLFEVILVDGMSLDGTRDVVQQFADRIDVQICEEDDGLFDAWNKGLNFARGHWCCFLGSDDEFSSNYSLSKILECGSTGESETALVFGKSLMQRGETTFVVGELGTTDVLSILRRGGMYAHTGSLMKTSALRSIGGFDDSFQIFGARKAAFDILADGHGTALGCNLVVTRCGLGGLSNSDRHRDQRRTELLRILRPRVGWIRAQCVVFRFDVQFLIARLTEVALVAVLGARRGERVVQKIRSLIGAPPKLHSEGKVAL